MLKTHVGLCEIELQAHRNSRIHCLNVKKLADRLSLLHPAEGSTLSNLLVSQNPTDEQQPNKNEAEIPQKLNEGTAYLLKINWFIKI